MKEHKENYAKIGLFVLAGVALVILAICIAGAREYNRMEFLAETYFAESVTGLDIGSPVKYRGVPIGKVKRIGFVSSEYDLLHSTNLLARKASSELVMVTMALDPTKFLPVHSADPTPFLANLVERGMRTKLASQGITGLSYLEIDSGSRMDSTTKHQITWQPHTFYIPSTPSTMTELKSAIESITTKITEVDLKKLSEETLATIQTLRQKMNAIDTATISSETVALLNELRSTSKAVQELAASPELKQAPADLAATLANARRITATIDAQLGPVLKSIETTSTSVAHVATNTSTQAEATLVHMTQAIQAINRTTLAQQNAIGEMIQNLRSASASINQLISELSANPGSLLYGQPPAPLKETR